MSLFLRNAVSKEKRRFKEDGFDLDLSYVTDRIIAMGFPSENVEAAYRNPMKEVLRFLDSRHKDHYKVYNLCSERGYDAQKFNNRVGLYPFDDHNAPPFELIFAFCKDVATWLREDRENIAVIHCKAGKGRTGLMICAFLLFSKEWKTADEAMSFYALARTNNQKGVTIPSQIRYVRYFHEALNTLGWDHPVVDAKVLILNKIVFHTLPKNGHLSDINFTIDIGKTTVFTYKDYVEKHKLKGEPKVQKIDKKKKKKEKKAKEAAAKEAAKEAKEAGSPVMEKKDEDDEDDEEETASFEVGNVPVMGDVRVDFDLKGARIFQFWFNTAFVSDPVPPATTLHLVLPKSGLDKAAKDKHHKLYSEKFKVELVFSPMGERRPSRSPSSNLTNGSDSSSSPSLSPSSSSNLTLPVAEHTAVASASSEPAKAPEPAHAPAPATSEPAAPKTPAAVPAAEPAPASSEPAAPKEHLPQPATEPAASSTEPATSSTEPETSPAEPAASSNEPSPSSTPSVSSPDPIPVESHHHENGNHTTSSAGDSSASVPVPHED